VALNLRSRSAAIGASVQDHSVVDKLLVISARTG
jgi:hypothetical protein